MALAVRALAGVVAAVLLGSMATSSARAPLVLPIVFHVAELDGGPVVDSTFIEARLERANQIFAPYAVEFATTAQLPLASKHAEIDTRADRNALGSYVGVGAIHCFVVRSLRDVDAPKEFRRGVHWHSGTRPGTHYVILSSIAGPNVLAHELGHFLGNPKHSQTPGNLMSYTPGDGLPFLDKAQLEKLELALHGYLDRKELRLVKPKPTTDR